MWKFIDECWRPLVATAAVAVSPATTALGESAPTFPELLRQAEVSSPRMLEASANVAAARGRARQAAAIPNPTVAVELEDFAGSGAYHGTSHSQLTVSLSEPIELGGQRGARIAVGRAQLDAAQARSSQDRAEYGYELALAYLNAELTHARLALLADDAMRAEEDLRSARALVDAGKEGELRSVQAQASASAAAAELANARADETAALMQLSSLAGVATAFTTVQDSLLKLSLPSTMAEASLSTSAPTVVTAQAERDAAEHRVTLERKQAIPTPSLMAGTRRLEGDNSTAWVAGISLPLPIFDRNRGAVDAARAELHAADARLAAARLDAAADWRTAIAQDTAAIAKLTAAEQSETSAREAYRLARIGYEAGRTPLYELLGTRRMFTEAQLRLLDARGARVHAQALLARLAGRIPFVE